MYRKSAKGWLKHYDFLILDLLALQLAFFIAYIVYHGKGNPYTIPIYREMAIFLILDDLAVIYVFDILSSVLKRGRGAEFTATAKQGIVVFLIAVLYLFNKKAGSEYSRVTLYLLGIFYFVLNYIIRIVWKKHLASRRSGDGSRSLLILADRETAADAIRRIRETNYEYFSLEGVVLTDSGYGSAAENGSGGEDTEEGSSAGESHKDAADQITSILGVPVVTVPDETPEYVCREWIDEVLVFPSAENPLSSGLMDRLAETGVTVHLHINMEETLKGNHQMVENIGGYTVMTSCLNNADPRQLLAKRLLDILGGILGCLITGILAVIFGPAIYLQSPGPIIFSQIRMGKNGKQFLMYKFRTMYMDAEERKAEMMEQNRVRDGMMFKLDFDPRVIGNKTLPDGTHKTGLGQFLRDKSLDEFPQFFNVLKGDMSLVGTRPPTTDEWNKYDLHHRVRMAVKPGITGMWQTSGRSDITDFEEVVRLDTWYIENWTFWLDIKLLIKTVWVVLTGKGSM